MRNSFFLGQWPKPYLIFAGGPAAFAVPIVTCCLIACYDPDPWYFMC